MRLMLRLINYLNKTMEGGIEKQNIKQEDSSEILERPLSPEMLEKVMKKVKDINETGTAYTGLGGIHGELNRKLLLRKTLENGLLGYKLPPVRNRRFTKEQWLEDTRDTRKGVGPGSAIWFHIVGRGDSDKVRPYDYGEDGLAVSIVFDLSHFKEISGYDFKDSTEPAKLRSVKTFQGVGPPLSDGYEEYNLFSRVAPRFFTGICVGILEKGQPQNDQHVIEHRINEIVVEMREMLTSKPESLLPIYDYSGNLLWPKQMTYEEVKRLVEERRGADSFNAGGTNQ